MTEFLVRAQSLLPGDFPDERRARMRTAERSIAGEWRTAGMLQRLWRIPGRADWIGLFTAEDATVLHDALTTLPMFPWLCVTVEPLATHPHGGARAENVADAPAAPGDLAGPAPLVRLDVTGALDREMS